MSVSTEGLFFSEKNSGNFTATWLARKCFPRFLDLERGVCVMTGVAHRLDDLAN